MRLVFLLPLCALAAPAIAQSSGVPHVLSAPNMTPVDGWGADSLGPTSRSVPANMAKAQSLVSRGRYAEADPLLNDLIGKTNSRHIRFLKGVTALGLGEPATARRFFEKALPTPTSGSPAVLSGLALAQVQLGNIDAARSILQNLRNQQQQCGARCDRAKPLDQAVSVVEKALI